VKEYPLLLKGELVKAVLDGRKTMTRRPIKPAVPTVASVKNHAGDGYHWMNCADQRLPREWRPVGPVWAVMKELGDRKPRLVCPWAVGDLLWVRETFAPRSDVDPIADPEKARHYCLYKATGGDPRDGMNWHDYGDKWIPSIHMPRWASRLTLKITDITVEPVREISEADAMAEGVQSTFSPLRESRNHSHREVFQHLWTSIYGEDSWEHDHCWAIRFEVVK
jgi:hypothetical protein